MNSETIVMEAAGGCSKPQPVFWWNQARTSAINGTELKRHRRAICDVAERFANFAPLIAQLFPETATKRGQIGSELIPVNRLAAALGLSEFSDRLFVKGDHNLPIAGSIKARGGINAVLDFAEGLARRHGLLSDGNYLSLVQPPTKSLFEGYSVSVGSTGNLGLSVGTMASALGFSASVHMSAEAKEWKKRRLRESGANVIEHVGDYAQALAAARVAASVDKDCFFIDDEDSLPLLYGYATAAQELAGQLDEAGVRIDSDHLLIVHLPCGVGGAPAGIALGLHLIFGTDVHCFFAEPVTSPCFMLEMMAEKGAHPTIYNSGLDGQTIADGLAVPRASLPAAEIARTIIAGGFTVPDEAMLQHLYLAQQAEDLQIEPSAAAGISGPMMLIDQLCKSDPYRLAEKLKVSTQVIWATGGRLMPAEDHRILTERGRALQQTFLKKEETSE